MRCKTCAQEKSLADFYVSNKSHCKECIKERVKSHRLANILAVRAYDKMRASMPHRVSQRSEYAKTDAGSLSHAKANKRWAERHPERKYAHGFLSRLVRAGKIEPWPVCEIPECDRKPQAHHPHYEYPHLVTWLCPAHHKKAHDVTREAATA